MVSRLYCYVHSIKNCITKLSSQKEGSFIKKTKVFGTLFSAGSVLGDFEHGRSFHIAIFIIRFNIFTIKNAVPLFDLQTKSSN